MPEPFIGLLQFVITKTGRGRKNYNPIPVALRQQDWGATSAGLGTLYAGVQAVYSQPTESKELLEKGTNGQCTFHSFSADGRLIHGEAGDLRTNSSPKVRRALDYMGNL